ncbi:site-specific DNA-methyltransferase [Halovenus sp. WSH3]|uniref:Type II methyltransferase n=1 Tax=Halovenus carboxidivorans TaxID=2692199 RepID=A0A6B0T1Y6_9EURY|nr:site-specific DNA-methyltransferase [Halovenus carboxidivorans]MXR52238.1 site-specific DNA-methyltransferase [Halovenus carboxidivorans]
MGEDDSRARTDERGADRETTHRIHAADARDLSELDENAVDLVVTSPPYPMVEMWDDLFGELAPEVESYLDAEKGEAAFEAMHGVLDAVWDELQRVVAPGGIVCLNVGDATRTVGGQFRVYPNHSRITSAFERRGFDPMPDILWHKPTNSAAKFMGSGMLPPSAYVTLEHEHILVFRNGSRRSFEPGADRRYEAAYFWEERNRWFTDVWTDVRGRLQDLDDDGLRDRAAAFPFEIPYRLCSMFSVYGDTVLDPFWGTGTTTLAAMVAGRNSIGYERDPAFLDRFSERVEDVPDIARDVIGERLQRHLEFVSERSDSGSQPDYESEYYGFPVMTSQEETLRLYAVESVTRAGESPTEYSLRHRPAEETTVVDRLERE